MTREPQHDRSDDLTVGDDSAIHEPDTSSQLDTTAAEQPDQPAPEPEDTPPSVVGSVAGSTWVGLSIGAIILVLLLVFILQNQDSVRLQMFVWEWNFPIGVGMLIAAIAGALVMACVGAVRILQLRRQINHPDRGNGDSEKAGFFGRRRN